jgi:lipoprotein-anchoring transpeptidase ErfK/SrfK
MTHFISRRQMLTGLAATSMARTALAQEAEPFPVRAGDEKELAYKFQRRTMAYDTAEAPGTIIVDPDVKVLYYVLGGGQALRYGVALGKISMSWTGAVTVNRMAKWPTWTPAPYHIQHMPSLAKWLPNGMPGGPDNPLGARAMYLYKDEVDTINRIHGGAKVEWIGKRATAGCISLLNVDVIDLYARVQVGARVVMLG